MVGAGHMGGAMLRRWLAAGLSPAEVTVVSPNGRPMPDGVRVLRAIPDVCEGDYDLILLALKPQQLASLRDGPLAGHRSRLLVSILAGVEVATLAPLCPAATVVRVMPNLPVAIGAGVIALHAADAGTAARDEVAALMAPLGLVEWIADEAQFDDVTALAGCGPAFLFRFADALAAAGASLGLPQDQAARLALATIRGAAEMAAQADVGPAVLADRVASPGGSTRQGLDVLDRADGLAPLLRETLAAAAARNREMAAAARRA